jgi:hypothetical protein
MVANLMFTSYEDNTCFIIPKVFKNVEIFFVFVLDNKIISGIEDTITEPDWKKHICTNLTSNEIFPLAVVGILTADVYTGNLLRDGKIF